MHFCDVTKTGIMFNIIEISRDFDVSKRNRAGQSKARRLAGASVKRPTGKLSNKKSRNT